MNLLFTGASGFLGHNILPALRKEYDKVTTLGHLPTDDITVNLINDVPSLQERYDIVLHAAGKAHVVPKTKEEEKAFYDVNFEGTKNLCSALERVGTPKSFIFISTVAVYGCESGNLITEEHPLIGTTPYAKSKIMAERFLHDWCEKNGVKLTILRPSLLAGKNPPGNLGDMIRGIEKGFYVNISGGKVTKSILMADDIANLIPLVSDKGGIYNVCDTDQPSFGELAEVIAAQLGKRPPISVPYWIAKILAICGDVLGKRFPINSKRLDKLTMSLTFSNQKALRELGWEPLKVLDNLQIR
ncbi:MAG: NAD-dependent epimerase/dehydratase family protein [Muribaculaceae bacterium]|nr:NAD-dependent epimerase/dehydratase family protein [Muribaculaceae bacterium]